MTQDLKRLDDTYFGMFIKEGNKEVAGFIRRVELAARLGDSFDNVGAWFRHDLKKSLKFILKSMTLQFVSMSRMLSMQHLS